MAESGILNKLETKYQLASPCARKEKKLTNAHMLTINEVAGMFVILAVGIASSFVVFLLEVTLQFIKKYTT